MASYKVFDQPKFQHSHVYTFWFRRYAPFDDFGATGFRFEGDHRDSGSTSERATSRTYGCLYFTTSEVLYGFSGSSGTTWEGYAPWTSGMLGVRILLDVLNNDAKGATAFTNVSLDVVENVQPNIIEFTASTAGAMPLLPHVSPDIDTTVKMKFDFTQKGVLAIKGHAIGDDFPNLEIFLVTPSGRSALLVDSYTTGGQDSGPMTRLLGSHDENLIGSCYLSLPLNDRGELISDYRAHPTTMPLGS